MLNWNDGMYCKLKMERKSVLYKELKPKDESAAIHFSPIYTVFRHFYVPDMLAYFAKVTNL